MPRPHVFLDIARRPRSAFRFPLSAFARRGLTLIEMLMATAITLLMMAAVVTLFANLSGSISNRRSLIELTGQLRQVRQQLARDLAGCTVPPGPGGLTPWRQRPGEAIGYFEIVEGGRSDSNPSHLVDGNPNNGEINYGTSLIPSGGDPRTLLPSQRGSDRDGDPALRENDVTNGGGLGDADDVLALTVRSSGAPFVATVERVDLNRDLIWDDFDNDGRPDEMQRESNLAEVIWYAVENQRLDDSATPEDETDGREPGMRTIYRRVLLIDPTLPPFPWDDTVPNNGRPRNISVHFDPTAGRVINANATPPTHAGAWVPNTLADLTRREYRFAHELRYDFPNLDFPHELDLGDLGGELFDRAYVVLENALAFDVRVFDPGAPLYLGAAGTTVSPNDPGWRAMIGATPPSGFGAYVDLGWNNAGDYDYTSVLGGAPRPSFQQEHQVGWHPARPNQRRGTPAVYDTWTWHYENDGRDQDGDLVYVLGANGTLTTVDLNNDGEPDRLIDEGTNGRDDPIDIDGDGIPDYGINGVDDVLERETSPPYPTPLRAARVILRTYERDARQIRESSVTNSFVP